jgi:GNAT superfamily N-acetyltransferase
MSIEMREVVSHADLMKFINFQFTIFKGNPYWVPPFIFDEVNALDSKKNPAFEHCEAKLWLAYRGRKIVGRIAGIINNKYIEKWGNKYARFGWIDFIDDPEVAKVLLDTVESWAKGKGMVGIQGPLGFTDLDKEGLLVEGFDELGTMPMIYNHPYYPKYIERCGYEKDVDWLEYEIKVPKSIPEKALRVQDLVLKRTKLRIYTAKKPKDIVQYGDQIFDLVNTAYSGLYGTVELTKKQIDAYINQYLGFADVRFVKLILDENDTLRAFGVAVPSLSRALQKSGGRLFPIGWLYVLAALKKPKYIDLLLVAVDPKYQASGIPALLMTSICQSAIEVGVGSAETSGELEDNVKVQSLWKDFERRQHKRRRAYKKMF